MTTEIIAGLLLIVRLVCVVYLYRVLEVQIALLRRPIEEEVWDFRRTLHYITVALFAGNFIPIILDAFVVLKGFGLLESVRSSGILILYAISNAILGLLASIMIYKLYALAKNVEEVEVLERKHLQDRLDVHEQKK